MKHFKSIYHLKVRISTVYSPYIHSLQSLYPHFTVHEHRLQSLNTNARWTLIRHILSTSQQRWLSRSIFSTCERTQFYHRSPQGGPLHFHVSDPDCSISSRMDCSYSSEGPLSSRSVLRCDDYDVSDLEVRLFSEPFLSGRETRQPFFHPSLPNVLYKFLNSAPSFLRTVGHFVCDLRCKLAANLTMQKMVRGQGDICPLHWPTGRLKDGSSGGLLLQR